MKNRHRSIVVLALVMAASLLAVGVAEAHVLSAGNAKRGARTVARDFAQSFADQGDTDVQFAVEKCSRRTAHRFVCRFFVAGTDANGQYVCRGFAVVRFASASSNSIVAKPTSTRLPCQR
jgi:endonuclease YncB( thermonuclease family)